MGFSKNLAMGLSMGLSMSRAAELERMLSQLDGNREGQRDELFRLLGRMNPSRLQRLKLRIVGNTPLLVHRMSDRVLAEIAGEIPRPYWDGDIERQHEAAAAAAGMIAKH